MRLPAKNRPKRPPAVIAHGPFGYVESARGVPARVRWIASRAPIVQPSGKSFQGCVGDPVASPGDPAGVAQQMPKLGREVAGVDSVLHVAVAMGRTG